MHQLDIDNQESPCFDHMPEEYIDMDREDMTTTFVCELRSSPALLRHNIESSDLASDRLADSVNDLFMDIVKYGDSKYDKLMRFVLEYGFETVVEFANFPPNDDVMNFVFFCTDKKYIPAHENSISMTALFVLYIQEKFLRDSVDHIKWAFDEVLNVIAEHMTGEWEAKEEELIESLKAH